MPCQVKTRSSSLSARTRAKAIIQSSDPIVLDTQILDINRKATKAEVIENAAETITINTADRSWCGRLQVLAWTFARTT